MEVVTITLYDTVAWRLTGPFISLRTYLSFIAWPRMELFTGKTRRPMNEQLDSRLISICS